MRQLFVHAYLSIHIINSDRCLIKYEDFLLCVRSLSDCCFMGSYYVIGQNRPLENHGVLTVYDMYFFSTDSSDVQIPGESNNCGRIEY